MELVWIRLFELFIQKLKNKVPELELLELYLNS